MASIYREGKYLYISYYVAGERKKPRKIATGIAWEGEVPTEASVKSLKSPEAKRLKAILAGINSQRDTIRFARRFPELVAAQKQELAKNYTFRQLADLYFEHKSDQRKALDQSTKGVYLRAIALLEAFRPNPSLKDLNKTFVKAFEKYIYATGYELSSLNEYLGKLRALVNFAVREEWIPANPLKAISISVPKSEPTHDDFEEECEYIRWAWKREPKFCLHYLYERLTGFRAGDGILLKRTDVHRTRGRIDGYNEKLRRKEPWPIHNSLALLLDLAELVHPTGEYVLPLRSYKSIFYRHQKLWQDWQMAKTGTHQWKRNYAVDIDEAEPPAEVGKHLKHHMPDELNNRYVARPMGKMLKYSNLALDKFIPLLTELLATRMQPERP